MTSLATPIIPTPPSITEDLDHWDPSPLQYLCGLCKSQNIEMVEKYLVIGPPPEPSKPSSRYFIALLAFFMSGTVGRYVALDYSLILGVLVVVVPPIVAFKTANGFLDGADREQVERYKAIESESRQYYLCHDCRFTWGHPSKGEQERSPAISRPSGSRLQPQGKRS